MASPPLLVPPFRQVVGLQDEIEYYVRGDPARPVSRARLSCGHVGRFVERKSRLPARMRCSPCMEAINAGKPVVTMTGLRYSMTVKVSGSQPMHFHGTTQHELERDLATASAAIGRSR